MEGRLVLKQINNTKGTSIVSVMVAFIILLMGIAMLYASVTVSQNMVSTAVYRLDKNNQDMQKLYGEMNTGSKEGAVGMYEQGEGNSFAPQPSFNVTGQFKYGSESGYFYFD